MDNIKQDEQIALFKYGIISPVLQDPKCKQKEYFIHKSKKTYSVPGLGERQFKWTTFKKWLRIYRKFGFDGLKPKSRKDFGTSRKIGPQLKEKIEQLKSQFQFPTISFLYRYLLENNIVDVYFTEQTLRKFLKDNQISLSQIDRIPRKKFEKEHINELWIADFMHGPYIVCGKRKLKTYLCAIIDDCSRLIVGAGFAFQESMLTLCRVFKSAVLTFGLPQAFYCDNGNVFASEHLKILCARLGIRLIHSKPYDSPSRGKIERFFRTVREKFLPNFYIDSMNSLDELNEKFLNWLYEGYNNAPHSALNTTPILKYHSDLESVSIKYPEKSLIDYFFFQSTNRLVRNDSTILFKGCYYEAPPKYIGKKIEIRFSIENPQILYLFENDKMIIQLTKLDSHYNAENPISYKEDENGTV